MSVPKEITTENNKEFEQENSIQEFLIQGEKVLWTSKTYTKDYVKTKIEEETGDSERFFISGHYAHKYTVSAQTQIREAKFLYGSFIVLGIGTIILGLLLKFWDIWMIVYWLLSASFLISGIVGFAKMIYDAKQHKSLININNIYVLTNRRIMILTKLKKYNLVKDSSLVNIKSVDITNLYNERRDIGDITITTRQDEKIKLKCVKGVRKIHNELNKNL